MENYKTNYIDLIRQISSALNLSRQEVREKYANYPICLLEYIENNVKDRLIEIQFDKEDITATCTFNSNEVCEAIFLYFSKIEIVKEIISQLNKSYDYDFIKSRWILSDCYIKIRESDQLKGMVYLMCYY